MGLVRRFKNQPHTTYLPAARATSLIKRCCRTRAAKQTHAKGVDGLSVSRTWWI